VIGGFPFENSHSDLICGPQEDQEETSWQHLTTRAPMFSMPIGRLPLRIRNKNTSCKAEAPIPKAQRLLHTWLSRRLCSSANSPEMLDSDFV